MPTARTLYRKELVRCREHFSRVNLSQERGYLMKYTTFSANVENIMPFIPRTEHEDLFRELLLQEIFTSFDQRCLTAGDIVTTSGREEFLVNNKEPFIYCTYHLGSYRLLTSLLFRKGVDCVLLVGSNMKESQGNILTEHFEALRQKYSLTNTIRLVDAGSPTAGLTLLREIKAGKSIITYVDGSAETGPEPGEEDKFIPVQFGNRRVLTRKGVGYLSHATGVPIIPVIAYRNPDLTNVLHVSNPIKPIRNSDRDMFCQEAMQQLYDNLWRHVQRYPGQWEGWSHIQIFLEPETDKSANVSSPWATTPTFNGQRYSICDLEEAPVLFDRRTYQIYEITDDLRDLLLNVETVESIEELVGKEVYNELREMEVLH
jgi:KDO2-lipid IV(A) lauroyltransferase